MRIKIDGKVDRITVDFENNLLIMKEHPLVSTALEIQNASIADGSAKTEYAGRLSYVALTEDERLLVDDFINLLLKARQTESHGFMPTPQISHIIGEGTQ